jgi:hypothetical protein
MNRDGKITAMELENYVNNENDGIPYFSKRLWQRPQTAVVTGEKDRTLVKFK